MASKKFMREYDLDAEFKNPRKWLMAIKEGVAVVASLALMEYIAIKVIVYFGHP